MSEPHAPPGALLATDVADIWTEEAQKNKPGHAAIRVQTVWSYRKESQPTVGQKPGRYARNPMPQPDGYLRRNKQSPWWRADREQELRDWWNSRPGRSHGTGGPRAGHTRATS